MNQTRILLLLVMVWVGLTASAHGRSRTIEGQEFPAVLRIQDTELKLNGAGLLRYAKIFKVYAAALYIEKDAEPGQVFDDVPKRIEAAYLRDVSTNIIIEAGDAALKKTVPPGKLAMLQDRIDRINQMYRDVKYGDRYTLTYLPGKGTELALNGKLVGVIEGADFAAEYFKIWIGENTTRPDLRDLLLGR